MTAKYMMFFQFLNFSTWSYNDHVQEAADFMTSLGPDRIISASHALGPVTVWYWEEIPEGKKPATH
jgi:hypothetical protein